VLGINDTRPLTLPSPPKGERENAAHGDQLCGSSLFSVE